MSTFAEEETIHEFCFQLAQVLRRLNNQPDPTQLNDLPIIVGERPMLESRTEQQHGKGIKVVSNVDRFLD
jgi:hypothetical protein